VPQKFFVFMLLLSDIIVKHDFSAVLCENSQRNSAVKLFFQKKTPKADGLSSGRLDYLKKLPGMRIQPLSWNLK